MAKEFTHYVIRGAQICSSQSHLCNLMGQQGPLSSPSPTAFEVEDTCVSRLVSALGSSVKYSYKFQFRGDMQRHLPLKRAQWQGSPETGMSFFVQS